MARTLADLRKEAVAERPVDFADITPYEIVLPDDTHIPMRNPATIPGKELDEQRGDTIAAQLRLLCETKSDYKRLWRHIGSWPREDLTWLVGDIVEHYEKQEEGKDEPSTS